MERRTTRHGHLLVLGVLCPLLFGCGIGTDLAAQRAQLEREHQARMEALADLEIRLLTVGARQRAWSELQERHGRISAIACENAAEHVAAMEAHDEKQRVKRRRLHARRVAEAQARARAEREERMSTVAVETGGQDD